MSRKVERSLRAKTQAIALAVPAERQKGWLREHASIYALVMLFISFFTLLFYSVMMF